MRKILLIARRDYLASVRTKAFLIGLLVAPILFGGSFFATALLKGHPDKQARRIALLDKTGSAAAAIIEQVEQQTRAQAMPAYQFETATPDMKDPETQLVALSDRVRSKELFAFIEVDATRAEWYSNEGGFGETQGWMAGIINDALRRVRLRALGVDGKQLDQALSPVPVESMNLVIKDEKTGQIIPARKRGVAEGFAAPFVLAILFFMIVLLTSAPMLTAVAEDKMQRVFEMLLASATPFELIGGKVLASIGTALTSSIFYVAGALVLLQAMAVIGLAPLRILPWFFLYLVAEVTILSSIATALGAACSSPRDAENFKFLLIAPVMIPIFFLQPVLQEPNGPLATVMSLFPLFTPILMLVRQASPGGIPAWQPWLGLAGAAAAAWAVAWLASRIFRVVILMQGKAPTLGELAAWGLKG